jgi:hypothetical protein
MYSLIGEPPSDLDGCHDNLTLSAVISEATNGPSGLAGFPAVWKISLNRK